MFGYVVHGLGFKYGPYYSVIMTDNILRTRLDKK